MDNKVKSNAEAEEILTIQEESDDKSTGNTLISKKYLTKKDYIFFSLAQFASYAVTGLVQGYLLFFYTVCVGISPSAVGTMFLFAKIFDGLNDPIMGVIVDRTRTKWGKMRPYLFIGAIPWGVLTIIMFMPSIYASMGSTGKIVYMWITYLLYSVVGTLVGVPINGMPAVASPNAEERAKIISVSRILGSIGEQAALVLLTFFLLLTHDDYPNSYMLMALIIGILGPIFMLLGAKFVKERLEPTTRTPSVFEGFKYLFKNKQFLLLMLSYILSFFRNLVSSMIIYVVSYIYSNGSLNLLFALPGAIAAMVGMLIAPRLHKKLDSKRIFIMATIWHSVALAVVFLLYMMGARQWWVVATLMFFAMIPVGILNVIPHLMATDTLDYWEDKTGDRCEGITFSLLSLRSKVCAGFKDYTLGWLLAFFGFSQALPFLNDHIPVQSEFTNLGLFSIYTIIPAVCNLVSIIPIIFYKLSGKKMAEIQGRLAVKRMADAQKLEELVAEETKGEMDMYDVIAENERKRELQKEIQNAKEALTENTKDTQDTPIAQDNLQLEDTQKEDKE